MNDRRRWGRPLVWWIALPTLIGALALARWMWPDDEGRAARAARGPVPVAVAPIVRGTIADTRVFTATLEPSARVVIAAEVAGTIRKLHANLSDEVHSDQVLVEIDDREYRQNEAAARAELAVARARASAAESAREIAERALERTTALHERGIASARELDAARATAAEARGAAEVAQAEVARARAAQSAARLQLERTRVAGRWSAEAGPRRVAERHVDEGARVSVGDPLFTLVDIDPLITAVMVGASDYTRLAVGQSVMLEGDRPIEGRVARIAPAFDPDTRQARIEIEVANPDGMLQPGMFVRARTVLAEAEGVTLVPESALTRRNGKDVIFIIDEDGERARMVEVEVGLRADGMVELRTEGLRGQVVTLGQQRLSDGSPVHIAEEAPEVGTNS